MTGENISWDDIIRAESEKSYYQEIKKFLAQQKSLNKIIYPPENKRFEAFNLTPFSNVKVVILGQDPYHGEAQAHGLAFSVPKDIKQPPSLKNIFKACDFDLNISIPKHGNLEAWAKQGVLLLNTILSVEKDKPNSHANKNWEVFTNQIITKLSEEKENLVFLLWGKSAHNKKNIIDYTKHLILESSHPSPLSAYRGFLTCKHFSKANSYLKKALIQPIDWSLI